MFPFKKKESNVVEYTEQNQLADNYLQRVINAASSVFGRSGGNNGVSADGKRDYNMLFGYLNDPLYSDYRYMFERGGIGYTVVSKLPKSCWRELPEVKSGDTRILEGELLMLKNAGFFKAMERADIANRIGSYSVLFIGIPDGLDPSLPIGSAKKGNFDGLYFNVYEEDGITVAKWNDDPASKRYNKPEIYELQTTANNASSLMGKVASRLVHYSRVVHLAEGAISNSLEGCSSLKAPWNALTDKAKISGSNAESNFKNSRQKVVLSARPGAKVDNTTGAVDKLKENAENFQNNQEDFLRLNNMDAMAIQPSISSPRDSYDINVEEVAGATGYPVRILTTKAGGSVTGSEDKATYNAMVNDRQDQECTPWLIDSLTSLAEAGILDLPVGTCIKWPVQSALSAKEESEVVKNKGDAFKSATEGLSTLGGDEVLADSVFKELGLGGIEIDDLDLSANDDKLNKSLEVK